MNRFFEKKIPGSVCIYAPKSELIRENLPLSPRKLDFLAGRRAAHLALKRLGIEAPFPIPKGKHGEPIWPSEVVGSISHCRTHCLCVVAPSPPYQLIGCDIEDATRMNQRLAQRILSEAEKNTYRMPQDLYATIIFCAKEAFYKLQHPRHRKSLSFKDIRVKLLPEDKKVIIDSFIKAEGFYQIDNQLVGVVLYKRA